jgi:hypothetical protein
VNEDRDELGLIVVEGDGFLREEIIRTMIEHGRSEFTHDRARLQVEITHHCITMLLPEHADGVVIDASIDERHAPPSA